MECCHARAPRVKQWSLLPEPTVDSKELEYECWVIYAGVPSFFGFWVRGWSCSNFLAPTALGTGRRPHPADVVEECKSCFSEHVSHILNSGIFKNASNRQPAEFNA